MLIWRLSCIFTNLGYRNWIWRRERLSWCTTTAFILTIDFIQYNRIVFFRFYFSEKKPILISFNVSLSVFSFFVSICFSQFLLISQHFCSFSLLQFLQFVTLLFKLFDLFCIRHIFIDAFSYLFPFYLNNK